MIARRIVTPAIRHSLARLACACLAFGLSAGACAEGYLGTLLDDFNEVKALSQRRDRFEYENDIFFKTDRNYTDGVRYSYKYVGLRQYRKPPDADEGFLPGFNLDPVSSEACADGKLCYHKSYTFYVGHSMYTPSDIKLAPDQLAPDDRPYAAWVYVGFYRELFASDGRYWRYGLDVGCIGPCAKGEQLQTFIHRNITHSPIPQGWSAQIHNEPGVVFRYEYVPGSWQPLPYLDLTPHFQFGAGNIQIYAGAGVTLRLGQFRSNYVTQWHSNHPLEALAAADGVKSDAGWQLWKRKDDFDLYWFARLHGDVVAYNALQQGGMFNRSSPYIGQARPLIVEGESGVALHHGDFSVSFSLVRRNYTDVLRLWNPRSDKFGRLVLEWAY
ncbi:MAG: lipid A deacylase LpxR family protein [Burkholderiales bacterium]|nr:lipid A deacylase LpxR family protein [Burkholderiales bacterium]